MNKIDLYNRNYAQISEARQQVADLEQKQEERLRGKLQEKLYILYIVNKRMNRKTSLPQVELSWMPKLPLRYDRELHRYVVSDFKTLTCHEDHILLEWEWRNRKNEVETTSFKFPLKWLSLSTWQFAHLLRDEIRRERQKELGRLAKEAREAARKEWAEAKLAVEKLQKEAATFEKRLDKLQRAEVEARVHYEEVGRHPLAASTS